MKPLIITLLSTCLLAACNTKPKVVETEGLKLNGTWKLVSGITITKGVSSVTDYTKDQQMIKIINDTHFAFLKHSLRVAKDSSNKFDAGGGTYTLKDNKYTEHLDFYSSKNWEGKTFDFTVAINNDTLVQTGLEKVEKDNIDRQIIEKYVRIK